VTESETDALPAGSTPQRADISVVGVLLLLGLVGAAVFGAFFGGVLLERKESQALAGRLDAVELERDALAAEVRDLKQQSIVLERSQQIDREANRKALEQLKESQGERLELEKEVSLLRRLFDEGGAGILRVKDLELSAGDEPDVVRYSFVVTQVIQDFGEASGAIELKVSGKRDGEEVTLPLSKLEGSEPQELKMKLKHFQSFEGTLQLPEDFEPKGLVVDIEPTGERLIPVSETFPWDVAN
jgi:hypothetical protein